MGNTPNVRFKGFTEDWEQRKVSELCSISTGKSNTQDKVEEGEYPFYVRSPIIERSTKYLYDEEAVITVGDGVGTGKVFHYVNGKYDLHQRCYRMYGFSDELNAHYFYHTFSKLFYKRVMAMTAKTSVDSVRLEMISDMKIPVPNVEEQRKIGNFLDGIDHLITLHQQKCDETKEFKKYMLQNMFPQKDEKVPKIRFAGFTGDWEQRKFSDCYKMSSGYAFKMSDYCDEGVGLINGESIQHGIINDDNLNHLPESFIQQYPEFLLKENDIVVGLNRPITNGNLKIARIPSKYNDSLLYQRAGKIVYKTDCDKNFTYVLLSQEILKHTLVEAVGSDQPFISTSKLDGWKMMMSSNMEEQVKIGEYFQNLDHLITLHQQKCAALKEFKKYMLQNMFPQKGENKCQN